MDDSFTKQIKLSIHSKKLTLDMNRNRPRSFKDHCKSQLSLPSLPSTSSVSSLLSNRSLHSNYSMPSTSSPKIIHSSELSFLRKNQSMNELHRGIFINTTTFSAPISPKYMDSNKLPSILKPLKKRKSATNKLKSRNQSSSNAIIDEDAILSNNRSYSLNDTISEHCTFDEQNAYKPRPRRKHKSKKNKSKMKRIQSMPAMMHLDLSTLSIDENSNKFHTYHGHNLTLNAEGIKDDIRLQFDLAPKSIDNLSLYEITQNGAFKQNNFIIASDGLEIEGSDTKYIVKPNDFVEVSILGRGSSSVVYKTWDLRNQRFIALKCISAFEQDKRKQIIKELQLLTNNDCANIVKFYGSYFYSGQIVFCLECFDIGSLQELIEINGAIPLNVISYIMKFIINAVDYLHTDKRIIYRDIKPSNILIHSNGKVKLSDFGIIHQCEESEAVCNEVIGTTIYMSPERLNGKNYSFLSDIWSIGLCVAQSIHPKFPLFVNYDDSTTLIETYVLKATEPLHSFFPNTVEMNDAVSGFLDASLCYEDQKRLSAKHLLQSAFILECLHVNEDKFKSYLMSSRMNEIKKDKNKIEMASIKQSLSELMLKEKISKNDVQLSISKVKEDHC